MNRIVYRWLMLLLMSTLTTTAPALAGGYVDGSVVLNPAKSINLGAVSVAPTFNNDQFNGRLLVGAVHNDPVRTPSAAATVPRDGVGNAGTELDRAVDPAR